jgi:leucyl aminopeptidase (aminopeptidase T)
MAIREERLYSPGMTVGTEPFERLLEAYARLVIRVGVNVQVGQRVEIRGLPEQAAVARALAAETYRVGVSQASPPTAPSSRSSRATGSC